MIRLEYFDSSNFKQLISWINTEELLINWSGSMFNFPLTTNSLDWYIEGCNLPNAEAFVYKAVNEENEVVGHISLGGFSEKNNSGRISRVIVGSSQNRSKGVCAQMVKAVIKIGFEDLNLHRISLGVYSNNVAAIKCYEKAGLKIEGIHKDILKYKNGYWSSVEMAILENEYFQ